MEQSEDRTPVGQPARVALATCARCGRLHPVEHLLDFYPLCPPCTR